MRIKQKYKTWVYREIKIRWGNVWSRWGATYNVVKDKYGTLKVVDDSGEDYIYNFRNPRLADGSSKGGEFFIIDGPQEELKSVIRFIDPDSTKQWKGVASNVK